MKKPKKITVKFFLNTHLNEILIDGRKNYPLYIQITYDRKNTQIKSVYGGFYYNIEQVKEKEANLLSFEERILKKAVRFELLKYGEDFRLKGIGRKYESYCLSTHQLFNTYLKFRFKNLIHKAEPKKFLEILQIEKGKTDIVTIFEASQRLFDNFNDVIDAEFLKELEIYRLYLRDYFSLLQAGEYRFPVMIDWLEGSHRIDWEEKLKNNFGSEQEKISECIDLLQKIINTKLEMS